MLQRPNPSLHLTFASRLRRLSPAGELKRSASQNRGSTKATQGGALYSLCRIIMLVFSLGAGTTSFAQEIPKDQDGFTELVAERFRKQVGDAQVTIKAPLTLYVGELQANLDRIYAFCNRNASRCDMEIETYVSAAARVLRDRIAPATREAIRFVVRTARYIQDAQGSVSREAPAIQPRPFVEGLVVVPVVDSPRTIRMLTEKDNKSLGLTTDEVHQLALSNTRAALRPLMEEAKVAGKGQIGQLVGNSLNPSRLALHDSWASLAEAQSGNLIVVAPATDAVLYVGEDTPVAIDALRTLARNIMARAPNPLSDVLLRWNQAGWEIVR